MNPLAERTWWTDSPLAPTLLMYSERRSVSRSSIVASKFGSSSYWRVLFANSRFRRSSPLSSLVRSPIRSQVVSFWVRIIRSTLSSIWRSNSLSASPFSLTMSINSSFQRMLCTSKTDFAFLWHTGKMNTGKKHFCLALRNVFAGTREVSKGGPGRPAFGTRSCSQGLVCYTFCSARRAKG